ncbi:lysozyme inhibitor LprI family protein [Bacillus sp. WOD8 KX774193]|uniref:lysozyme inhibitor LprI family protein n=1 Tax=Bacillus sp. WOD8 KX774193 TaxID=3096776 RepID=UPI002DB88F7F|nr:lysozyme inhibitor LprI family protein [Bacillus sp. WOD8 KX774193]MEC3857940.1 lysozyme inhibitor LprI family protein [Bacillus sp. WOD8 KX774193]
MKKMWKVMSFCLAASMLVITGCENSNNKVQANEKIEQHNEAPEVTEKEAKKIVRKSVDGIANSFSEMEKENGWSRTNPGDLNTAKKGVKGLVTDKFVENQLPESLKTFNRSRDTDMWPFPINIEPEMRFTYSQKNDILTIETIIPANDMGNAAEIWEFILIYKGEKWLIDKWSSHTPSDLKLTREEANELLKIRNFKNVVFVREENSDDKKYIFKDDTSLVTVDAKTSVITINSDNQKEEKVANKNSSQEHENNKENNVSKHVISKEEKQNKKETPSAVGKTKALNELAALEEQETHGNVASDTEILNEIEGNYQLWDDKLNEIYNTLKNNMSADAFQSLKTEQIAWIKEKESQVKTIGTDPMNGSMRRIEAREAKYNMTKERCYELVNRYMN